MRSIWPQHEPEGPRDENETDFTPVLRELVAVHPVIRAAVFVDAEGECVDYCACATAHEAKLVGAHLQLLLDFCGRYAHKVRSGPAATLDVYCSRYRLSGRNIGEGYMLGVLAKDPDDELPLDFSENAADGLRASASVAKPLWEPLEAPVYVELRRAVGWAYAPAILWEGGRRIEIAAVLGRSTEPPAAPTVRGRSNGQALPSARRPSGLERFSYRVRSTTGAEFTLSFHPQRLRWQLQS